jgi:hypothetical protein
VLDWQVELVSGSGRSNFGFMSMFAIWFSVSLTKRERRGGATMLLKHIPKQVGNLEDFQERIIRPKA